MNLAELEAAADAAYLALVDALDRHAAAEAAYADALRMAGPPSVRRRRAEAEAAEIGRP